jgi:hypothetical protein
MRRKCEKARPVADFPGQYSHRQQQEWSMRVLFSGLVLSTVVVASGCGDREPSRAALHEDYLNRELALALASFQADAQRIELNDGTPLHFEAEPEPAPPPVRQAAAPRPSAPRAQSAPVRQPQPQVVTQSNAKRDAAIGAGVGAAVGAVAHKPNRWKGAVIGAAVGGAAGAVVGSTINKKTTVVYH